MKKRRYKRRSLTLLLHKSNNQFKNDLDNSNYLNHLANLLSGKNGKKLKTQNLSTISNMLDIWENMSYTFNTKREVIVQLLS